MRQDDRGAMSGLPAHNLTDEELAEFREIFNLVDRDGGGTITKEELGELMDTLGIDATPEEIDLMINEIDQDSNGEIDFEGEEVVDGGDDDRRVTFLCCEIWPSFFCVLALRLVET